jgi:transcription regulator MmyB-like protein
MVHPGRQAARSPRHHRRLIKALDHRRLIKALDHRRLIKALRQGCPEFAGWWEAHDIGGVSAGQKSLSHPRKGRLKLEYASFQANDDPALKLIIYTAA